MIAGLGLAGWRRAGFYMGKHFVDCVGAGVCGREVFFAGCMCVVGVFKVWIAKGVGRWDLWLVDWGSKWACRGFLGFGGRWGLGRGMG